MDKTQAVAFCDYAIGMRVVGGSDTGEEVTTPHAPELRAFVVSRVGDLMPIYCQYLHPANRGRYQDAELAPRSKAFADLLREVADAIDPPQPGLWDTIDAAHTALRMVDASDQTTVQTEKTLDAVMEAVALIERTAIDAEHVLPEFRALYRPMRVPGGAQT